MVSAALELYACFFYFTAALPVYWGFKTVHSGDYDLFNTSGVIVIFQEKRI